MAAKATKKTQKTNRKEMVQEAFDKLEQLVDDLRMLEEDADTDDDLDLHELEITARNIEKIGSELYAKISNWQFN